MPAGQYHVFVGGLPYDATAEQVRAYFQRDGCYVWAVRLAAYGPDSDYAGEGRGFAHVELETEQQVARALLRHGDRWEEVEGGDGGEGGAVEGKGEGQAEGAQQSSGSGQERDGRLTVQLARPKDRRAAGGAAAAGRTSEASRARTRQQAGD